MPNLGDYIREQRDTAQMSLRQLARLAGVSNPYLSQIERGMRRPSAEILQQIAKGLRISAEALFVQAGILDERLVETAALTAIRTDPTLLERQRQILVEIYESFQRENDAAGRTRAGNPAAADTDADAVADVAEHAAGPADPWAAATAADQAEVSPPAAVPPPPAAKRTTSSKRPAASNGTPAPNGAPGTGTDRRRPTGRTGRSAGAAGPAGSD